MDPVLNRLTHVVSEYLPNQDMLELVDKGQGEQVAKVLREEARRMECGEETVFPWTKGEKSGH